MILKLFQNNLSKKIRIPVPNGIQAMLCCSSPESNANVFDDVLGFAQCLRSAVARNQRNDGNVSPRNDSTANPRAGGNLQ